MIKVSAAIILNDNKILIAKRSPHKEHSGFWEFPGGKVKKNETIENSLNRELKEVFNIEVKVLKKFHENFYKYLNFEIHLFSYIVVYIRGTYQLKDHDEIRWVKPNELVNFNLTPADIPVAKKIIDELNNPNFR